MATYTKFLQFTKDLLDGAHELDVTRRKRI